MAYIKLIYQPNPRTVSSVIWGFIDEKEKHKYIRHKWDVKVHVISIFIHISSFFVRLSSDVYNSDQNMYSFRIIITIYHKQFSSI